MSSEELRIAKLLEENKRLQTQLNKLEEAKRFTENIYNEGLQKLFEMSHDLMCIADLKTYTFLKTNPAFENSLGYSENELLSQSFLNFIYTEDIKDTKNVIKKYIETGEGSVGFTNRYICKNGSHKLLKWTLVSQIDNGIIYAIACDITKFKEISANYESQNSLLKGLYDNTLMGIIVIDSNGNLIQTNKALYEITGYQQNEISTLEDWFPKIYPDPKYREYVLNDWAQSTKEKNAYREFQITCKNGWKKDIGFTGTFLHDGRAIVTMNDISDRKKIEKELIEKERGYYTLLQNLNGMAYRCINDENWTMKFVSDGCMDLTGYESDDLIDNKALSFNDLILPEDREVVWKLWQKNIISKKIAELEYRIRTKNGTLKNVWEKGIGVYDNTGKLLYLEGYIVDITKRKKAESEVKKNEQKYISVLSNSLEGIFVLCGEKIVYANPAIQKITGYGMDEILKMNFWEAVYEEDRELIFKNNKRRLAGEHLSAYDFRVISKSGTVNWVLLNATKISWEGKDAVLVFMQNINDRKNAEQALRESEAKFRSVFQASALGMAIINNEGKLTAANEATTRILGYTKSELKEKNLIELIHPCDKETSLELLKKAMITGLPFSMDRKLISKNGDVIVGHVTISPVFDSSGKFSYSIVHLQDITSQKEIEQALKESEEKYRLLIENQTDLIVKVDMDGRFLFVSKTYCEKFGKSEEELLGKKFMPLVHDEDKAGTLEAMESLYSPPYTTYLEQRAKTKDGWKWLAWHDKAILNEKGKVVEILGVGRDITEKKQNEQKIKEDQLFIESIAEQSPDIIYIYDVEKEKNIYINKSLSDILGYSLHEVPEDSLELFNKLSHPDDRNLFDNYNLSLLKDWDEKYVNEYEYRLKDKHGNWRWFFGREKEFKRKNGKIVSLIGVVGDVTERKLNEQALEKRIKVLEQPLEKEIDISFEELFDIHEIQAFQDAFAEITGVASIITDPKGFAITKPSNFTSFCGDIIRKTAKGAENCQKSDAKLGELSLDCTAVRPCLSGGLWDASANIVVGGKHIANWLVGQVRDESQTEDQIKKYAKEIGVDERVFIETFKKVPKMSLDEFSKIVESLNLIANLISRNAYQNLNQARFIAEKKKSEIKLMESESKFKRYIEYSPTPIFIANKNGRFNYVNKAASSLLKYAPIELMKMSYPDIQPEDNREKELEMFFNLKIRGVISNYETKLKTKTKRLLPVILDATKISKNQLVIFCKDITEIKKTEKLKNEVKLAEETAQVKQQLLANISHEMRTPMNGIIGMADFLADTNLDSTQEEYLQTIKESSESLLHIINDVLKLSKIEQGQLEIIKEPTNIYDLFENVCKVFSGQAKAKKLDLTHEIEENFPGLVLIDKNQFRQILFNLISNSIKYTHKGFVKVKLRLLKVSGKKLLAQVDIEDSGIGIRINDKEKLFEPFMRIDDAYTKTTEGTGLGLSIVKKLVGLFGGEIDFESSPNKGSVFWFTFETEIVDEIITQKNKKELLDIKNYGLEILLAEDKIVNQKVAAKILENNGCKVDIAKNGEEVLEMYEKDKYDIILMDIMMPKMDGITATQKLRDIYKKLPPIIGLSAHALEGDAKRFVEMGLDDYIEKPIDKYKLIEKLFKWKMR